MPKGGATSLIPVSAGLQQDLEMFLRAFLDTKSQRFSDYKALFQHRKMIELHNGRNDSAEIIEFNEQLLVSCLPYMEENICAGTSRSLEERLFGIYSLYTFFYTQVAGHVVKIRVDPDASRNFCQLTKLLLKEKIYDAYMACLKLLQDKAFKHVAFIQVYDPALFKRFGSDNQVQPTQVYVNVNDPLERVKELVESPLFLKLSVVHNEYARLKKKAGIAFDGQPLLNVQEACRKNLERRMNEVKGQMSMSKPIRCTPSVPQKSHLSRSEIKDKAYRADLNLSRSRRHYTTANMGILQEKFEFTSVDNNNNVSSTEDVLMKSIIVKSEPRISKKIKESKLPLIPKIEIKTSLKSELNEWMNEETLEDKQLRSILKKPKIEVFDVASLKVSGRRTNNSVASELFCFAGFAAAKQTPKQNVEIPHQKRVTFKLPDDDMEEDEFWSKPSSSTERVAVKRRATDDDQNEMHPTEEDNFEQMSEDDSLEISLDSDMDLSSESEF